MIDIPDFRPLRITHSADKAVRKQIDPLDHLIAVVPGKPGAADFRTLPKPAQMERLHRRLKKGPAPWATTHLDNPNATGITLAVFDDTDRFAQLTWARKLIAEATRGKVGKLGILTSGLDGEMLDGALSALIRAADAAAFELPTFKSKPDRKRSAIRSVRLFGPKPSLPIAALRRGNLGNNLARWLSALPPNKLTAASYREICQSLGEKHSLHYSFLGLKELKQRGAGAFLAVAQGNPHDDAGIVHLSYRPDASSTKTSVALVGKGVLFDTGGTNLKPFKSMLDMHLDMQGSAVALGAAIELAESGVDFPFDVWLAVTENRISGTAYKSQDVVVASNGTSIQVIHTDAEGRMVLADALAIAAEDKPALIIDYATLTGACIMALTTRYSGVFSNRAGSVRSLLDAGVRSGERVWPFPLDDDFGEPIKSDVADVMQCAIDGNGDHIMAARFLERFVPKETAWLHVDLSAGQHKGGLGAIPTEITGFGVHFTLELLSDHDPSTLVSSWA